MFKRVNEYAAIYSKVYIRYLIENDITLNKKSAYDMFKYIICNVYGIGCDIELFPLLVIHFESCKNALERATVTPSIDKETALSIIKCSCVYTLVAIQYCAGNIRVRVD